jgi:hypothetical protein
VKIRNGFVSNSSSSSFAILRSNLTDLQVQQIQNHDDEAGDNAWTIEVGRCVIGNTSMDNFDMAEFLSKIGICDCKIKWGNWFDFDDDSTYFSSTCCSCSQTTTTGAIRVLLSSDFSFSNVSDWDLQEVKELIDKEVEGRGL